MRCNETQLLCQNTDSTPLYCLDVPDIERIDCSLVQHICSCPQLRANPDIAGIGVVIAFLASAFLAWITTFSYLLLRPRAKPKRKNPVDEFFTKHLCTSIQRKVKKPDVWAECLFRVTSTLSDQQLVTGIAIVTASFSLHSKGPISAYHFYVVRDLAFFSSSVHILSLLILGSSLRSERKQLKKDYQKRRLPIAFSTWLRLLCMLVLFGLLMASIWKTAFRFSDAWATCPARCIPNGRNDYGGIPLNWAIASTYFLVYEYTTHGMYLGEVIFGRADAMRKSAHDASKKIQALLKDRQYLLKTFSVIRGAIVVWRYYTFSEFITAIEILFWMLTNCYWVAQNRRDAIGLFGNSSQGIKELEKEDEWGFGQIVPVMLLMLPVLTFFGTYHEIMEEKTKNERTSQDLALQQRDVQVSRNNNE